MSMQAQIENIRSQRSASRLSGTDFERLIHEALEAELPFCVMPNVALFRPDQFRTGDDSANGTQPLNPLAYEIDNLFHYRRNEIDYIAVVEAKAQKVTVASGQWQVSYQNQSPGQSVTKDVRKQMRSHAETILRYLRPMGRNVELRIHAILVSSDPTTSTLPAQDDAGVLFELCSFETLPALIKALKGSAPNRGAPPQFLRIAQSEYMTLLRLGIPVKSLGHPELRHAIHYINRCKRDIDHELYRIFEPSKRRWAINGTAGMGKSVLLAYATAVLACEQELEEVNGLLKLTSHQQRAKSLGVRELSQRNICVFAMKPKQRSVLEFLYAGFMRDLSDQAPNGELYFLKPKFDVWMDEKGVPNGCNILVVDESHDLSESGQEIIRNWHEASEENYLVLACDRHQKIKLSNSSATIIKGLSFSGFTKRLSRNYRNPFPVYAASLALMFRWFAKEGVKVIPTIAELKDLLGFDTDATSLGNQLVLKLRNDSHPANLWSHSVGSFRSCSAVFSHLLQQNLVSSEVLWVRFSNEDPDFNYEQLNCFTYHNFCSDESADLVDKYVKGQEFPIVVVEGFPDLMDVIFDPNRPGEEVSENERRMWSFRRQIYICASRATAFLYFVCNAPETAEVKQIKGELDSLVSALSMCSDPAKAGSKEWRFVVNKTSPTRKVSIFDDLLEKAVPAAASPVSLQPTPTQDAVSKKPESPPTQTTLSPAPKPPVAAAPPAKLLSQQTIVKPTVVPPVRSAPPSLPPSPRNVITIKKPIVVSEFAAALGKSVPSIISNFNGIGIWPNAKTIVSEAEAVKLAAQFNTDLVFSESL